MRFALALALVAGCATQHHVNVAPIHVDPIRVQMDVNVNVHESPEPVGQEAHRSSEDAPDEG